MLIFGAVSAPAAIYHLRGVVLELRPETQTVVIQHEAVPGLMPEMTMPFAVPAEEDFSQLSVNDVVRFQFVMETSGSFARSFEVVGKVAGAPAAAQRRPVRTPRMEPGEVVPAVELIDQDGAATRLRDDAGRFTLLTFIFTRCPVPDFCPLMSARFQELHGRLEADDRLENTRLLSITIDPEHDTPEILRAYGESLGADFETWTFATAAPEVIDGVTSGFRLFRERNGVQLDHALATALIAPDGTVIEIWRGNGWTTDTVYERTSEAIENEVSASAT